MREVGGVVKRRRDFPGEVDELVWREVGLGRRKEGGLGGR